MTTEASGVINTDNLPMAQDRDGSWRTMRRHPLVEVEGGYAVTHRDLVETVLKQPGIFSSKKAFDVLASPIPLVPVAFDPPEQTRYRRILQPFFSPRVIKPMEPELRRQAIELIEPIAKRGSCDFVAEVGGVFPVQVFLTLFGLPLEMRDQFVEWKDAVLGLTSASGQTSVGAAADEGLQKAAELFMYLSELIQQRRGQPGDDVLSRVLALEGEDALSDEEAIGLCFLFVLAGLDTVMDALGFGMQRLAENPDKRQQILDDPALIPAATEELLRLDPPAPFIPRVTAEETVLDGQLLPAGTRVTAYLAAANRDEDRHLDPYAVDFHRGENPHISFGMGVHRCLGSHLARLEMHIVYEEWHRLIPHYRITSGTTPQVHWPRGTTGLESLHLTFDGKDT
ncbi:cytochrome P450 [Nocardia sp. NBC_00565]|uniref:cytochrome P450 n=1 Tax=Nocardia sp. NBC_00565 TaxID=2975993 RepID=UPI002E8146DE|nr:cytochrome P450 [Nocardia sp. NBC_00565]WUC05679.1 cytochrome P450 [Nocardia sp. NBC_00565]